MEKRTSVKGIEYLSIRHSITAQHSNVLKQSPGSEERSRTTWTLLTEDGNQVNVPKTRRTYCKGKDCKKHTNHKVTQYKAGKVNYIPCGPFASSI